MMRTLSFLLAALSIPAIFCIVASATQHDAGLVTAKKHRRLADAAESANTTTTLEKRGFGNARFTYYYVEVGEVACGGWYHDGDHVRIFTDSIPSIVY